MDAFENGWSFRDDAWDQGKNKFDGDMGIERRAYGMETSMNLKPERNVNDSMAKFWKN